MSAHQTTTKEKSPLQPEAFERSSKTRYKLHVGGSQKLLAKSPTRGGPLKVQRKETLKIQHKTFAVRRSSSKPLTNARPLKDAKLVGIAKGQSCPNNFFKNKNVLKKKHVQSYIILPFDRRAASRGAVSLIP